MENVSKEVFYPFGYGLSYTTFEYGKPSVNLVNGVYKVNVEVVIPETWQVVKLLNFMPLPLRGLSQAVIGISLSVHRPVTSALPLRSMSRLRLLKSETSSSLTDPSIS